MNQLAPRALYISCTPPLPRDFGNRNRVYQTFNFLTEAGFSIDFLLYPFDYDWERQIPPYVAELQSLSDLFVLVPNAKKLHQPAADGHHVIDEWWDVSLELHVRYLQARRSYDLVFVNYVFFSKAFEFFDKSCLKVLDTHDMMTGRKEMLQDNGVDPEFFYTTREQESLGLGRADVVLAIKDSEADDFRGMCEAHVISLPFRAETVPSHRRIRAEGEPLRVGFIGAENSVNVVNMRRFIKTFAPLERLYAPNLEIRVAGNVCKRLASESYSWLTLLGRVEDVTAFYADVDVIFVPLAFSTGQKIKVAEALSYGMPIVATRNGFDGFTVHHPLHALETLREVALAVINLAFEPEALVSLAEASLKVDADAEQAVASGFDAVRATMSRRFERVVFVVDRPFWKRETLGDELWWQAAEYISHRAPVLVLTVGVEGAEKATLPPKVQAINVGLTCTSVCLPSVLEVRCIVSYEQAALCSVKIAKATPAFSLELSDNGNEVVLREEGGKASQALMFPRFLPSTFGSQAVSSQKYNRKDVDVIEATRKDGAFLLICSAKTPESLIRQWKASGYHVVNDPLIDGLDTSIKALKEAFTSNAIFVGHDMHMSEVTKRILSLRDYAFAECEVLPVEIEVRSALREVKVQRSDAGWDYLWSSCSG